MVEWLFYLVVQYTKLIYSCKELFRADNYLTFDGLGVSVEKKELFI